MRVVIPSVSYADFLAVTLPAWCAALPVRPFIVTAAGDKGTAQVAEQNECPVIVTDVWRARGALFNKARALDQAFGFENHSCPEPEPGELCLSIDADAYPIGAVLWDAVEPRVLYSVPRYSCPTPEAFADHISGRLSREEMQEIKSWRGSRQRDPAGLQGYFQLWRYRRGDKFGSYPTAARYDVDFGHKFKDRRYLETMYVVHLGEHRKNWNGRVTPEWRAAETIAETA